MSRLSFFRCAVLGCALVFAASCRNESATGTDRAGQERAGATQSGSPPATSVALSATAQPATVPGSSDVAAPAEGLTRQAVEDLLQRWLAAQNSRAFSDYAATYAQRFTGIKRVASQTSRMDRARWLRDRAQMFPRIVRVRAEEPQISVQRATASVRFEQHWASENFEDRGTKLLTIVLEDGQPRIAREELLDSHVLGGGQQASSQLLIVHRLASKNYLIVGDGATLEKPELHVGKGTLIAFGKVNLEQASAMAGWRGRALRVYSAAGKSCLAEGGELMGIALVLPHFGEQARWEEEKVPPAERAAQIAASGRPQYALAIESVSGDCDELVLGQAASQPDPKLAEPIANDRALDVAMAAFRKLPEYQREQRSLDEFRKETQDNADANGPKRDWIEFEPVVASRRVFQLGSEHYVWLSYNAGAGCGGWEGGLSRLFRVELGKSPKATALSPHATGDVTALVDSNLDGRVEVLLRPTFSAGATLLDERGRTLSELAFSNFDCPC